MQRWGFSPPPLTPKRNFTIGLHKSFPLGFESKDNVDAVPGNSVRIIVGIFERHKRIRKRTDISITSPRSILGYRIH